MFFSGFLFVFITYFVLTCTIDYQDGASRIVGGNSVKITEVPYQVALLSYGSLLCGGAIIANETILTAAHCVSGAKPNQYHVRVGSSYSESGGELYQVEDLIWHPGYNNKGMDFDIAILRLSNPLKFSIRVMPIEMKKEDEEIPDGDMTIVSGWGKIQENGTGPKTLQRVSLPKVSDLECRKEYAEDYAITPRMLCAGVPEGGVDACQGDSGGPLVHSNKLAGVVSWGLGCARPNHPGVYAKVSVLRTWIDKNIAKLRMREVQRQFS